LLFLLCSHPSILFTTLSFDKLPPSLKLWRTGRTNGVKYSGRAVSNSIFSYFFKSKTEQANNIFSPLALSVFCLQKMYRRVIILLPHLHQHHQHLLLHTQYHLQVLLHQNQLHLLILPHHFHHQHLQFLVMNAFQ
jgi:hypothetical protein